MHPSVELAYLTGVPTADQIPDGDAVFATAWRTAELVSTYPPSKGAGCYLIQGWETWGGHENEVRRTWMLPLRKVVVSRWLQAMGQSIGATALTHIPNAIDHALFYPMRPIITRAVSVVSMYDPTPRKGFREALQVFERLHHAFPEVPVTLFGTVGATVPPWITYIKNPSQPLLREIYNRHSIVLSASHEEGWSLPPAEAMACGCAFVGTDSKGCRDYAINGTTALLSPARDVDALWQNLFRAVTDAALRQTLQRNGHSNIQAFTWERSGSALEEWLRGVTPCTVTHPRTTL